MFYNQQIQISKRYVQETRKCYTARKYGEFLDGIILFSLLIISLKKFILGTELVIVCTLLSLGSVKTYQPLVNGIFPAVYLKPSDLPCLF